MTEESGSYIRPMEPPPDVDVAIYYNDKIELPEDIQATLRELEDALGRNSLLMADEIAEDEQVVLKLPKCPRAKNYKWSAGSAD